MELKRTKSVEAQQHLANMTFSTFTEQIKELTTTKAKAKAYEKRLKWLTLAHDYKSNLAMQKVFMYLKGEKCAARLRLYVAKRFMNKWKKTADREFTRGDWYNFYYRLVPLNRVRNFIIQNEKAVQARALLAANNIKKLEEFIPNFNFLFDSLDIVTQPVLDLTNPAFAYPDPKPEVEEEEEEDKAENEENSEVLYEEKRPAPTQSPKRIVDRGIDSDELSDQPSTPPRHSKSTKRSREVDDPQPKRSPSRRNQRESESEESPPPQRHHKKHVQQCPPESESEPEPAPPVAIPEEPVSSPKPNEAEAAVPIQKKISEPEPVKPSGPKPWVFVLIIVGIAVAIALMFVGKHLQALRQEVMLQNELLKHTEAKARDGRNVFYVRP